MMKIRFIIVFIIFGISDLFASGFGSSFYFDIFAGRCGAGSELTSTRTFYINGEYIQYKELSFDTGFSPQIGFGASITKHLFLNLTTRRINLNNSILSGHVQNKLKGYGLIPSLQYHLDLSRQIGMVFGFGFGLDIYWLKNTEKDIFEVDLGAGQTTIQTVINGDKKTFYGMDSSLGLLFKLNSLFNIVVQIDYSYFSNEEIRYPTTASE